MRDEVEYIVVNFLGYYRWAKRNDGLYVVDPQFIEDFKEYFKKQNKVIKKQLL